MGLRSYGAALIAIIHVAACTGPRSDTSAGAAGESSISTVGVGATATAGAGGAGGGASSGMGGSGGAQVGEGGSTASCAPEDEPCAALDWTHPAPQGSFVDRTAELGVDFLRFSEVSDGNYAAVCMIDYDGDDDLDLYFPSTQPEPNRLYRNDGAQFTDVTVESKAGVTGYFNGCLAFDMEGDGDLDIYLSAITADQILRNDGGVFKNVTFEVGLADQNMSSSVAAGDIDGDGDNDIVVARYMDAQTCAGKPLEQCTPLRNLLFENQAGKYVEVGLERGLSAAEPTLAIALLDLDRDGDLDLYEGNDLGSLFPDRTYLNDGTGHFTDVSVAVGLAWDGTGLASACTMGVTFGDFDLNGVLDVARSNAVDFTTQVFACDASADDPPFVCEDIALQGLGLEASRPLHGWGIGFADFDDDGWLDLLSVSGRANMLQPKQLFFYTGSAFEEFVPAEGDAIAAPQNSRGTVFGDIDGDGDVDAVVANVAGAPQVLVNELVTQHWLAVALDTMSAGASVTVAAGAHVRTQPVLFGGGYLGSSDPRVHFGLGQAKYVDVVVTWLDGTTRSLDHVAVDQVIHVERP